MTEQITNKDYITINRDGVFVDGKPATKYHGKETCFGRDIFISQNSAEQQKQNQNWKRF